MFNKNKSFKQQDLIKYEIHKIYYSYVLILTLVTLITTYKLPIFKEIFIIITINITANIYGLVVKKARYSSELFTSQILIHTIIVTYFKFSIVNENGSGPLSTMLELSISITCVYYYGKKYGLWIPLLFILSSYYRLYLIEHITSFTIDVVNPNGGRLMVTGFALMIYTTLFSGLFSHRVEVLLEKNEKNNIALDIASLKAQAQNLALIETFKKLEDVAVINSHRLRAPIARIKGLLIMYNELKNAGFADNDAITTISLKNEIINSINEFNIEYEKIHELIKQ